jgi:hypothetical protein
MDHKPGDIIKQEWNYNEWDFFKNDISSEHHLIKKPPTIPPCKRRIIFNTMYLSEHPESSCTDEKKFLEKKDSFQTGTSRGDDNSKSEMISEKEEKVGGNPHQTQSAHNKKGEPYNNNKKKKMEPVPASCLIRFPLCSSRTATPACHTRNSSRSHRSNSFPPAAAGGELLLRWDLELLLGVGRDVLL